MLLYDNERHTTPIIVEVCHTSGVRNDCKKIMRLINEFDYSIEEGFLYDYVAHQWLRYRKGEADLEPDQSFSSTLQLDFNAFL